MRQHGTDSVHKLALGSAICGCIATLLSCPVLSAGFVFGYLTEAFPILGFFLLGLLITAVVMGLIGVALGAAALNALPDSGGEGQRRRLQAWSGVALGLTPTLLICLVIALVIG